MSGGLRVSIADRMDLFRDLLDRGVDVRVSVTGRSMGPLLRDGDIVTVRSVPFASLRWGDIIFFRNRSGQPVMHRIVRWRRGDEVLAQTGGDAALCLDPPVGEGDILGKVLIVERGRAALGGRQIGLDTPRWRAIGSFLAFTILARVGLRVIAKRLGLLQCASPNGEQTASM